MYISNGIVYAGNPEKLLKVTCVEPLADYKLRITFSDSKRKIFDVKPLLTTQLFSPLKDINLFNRVYLDFGVVSWNDGSIDIATSVLYEDGIDIDKKIIA